VRRLQFVLAGLSSGGLHHDGGSGHASAVAILGKNCTGILQIRQGSAADGLLIQNATVVTAEKTFAADILVEGETIKEIRAGIAPAPAYKTLDASGMLLLPGGIDAHTHLDMPFGGTTSSDDFETGPRPAADR